MTVTLWPLAALSETVKLAVVVPVLPSTTETSSIVIDGAGSSSVIVPTPSPSLTVAAEGPVRLTLKFSFASLSASPFTVTGIVLVVSPGAKTSVPPVPV